MQYRIITNLKSGDVFANPLFSKSGKKLLNANIVLTLKHINTIKDTCDGQLYEAISSDQLLVGLTTNNTNHSTLTDEQPSPQTKASYRRTLVLMADELSEKLLKQATQLNIRVRPAPRTSWLKTNETDSWFDNDQLNNFRVQITSQLTEIYNQINTGFTVDTDIFDPPLDQLIEKLSNFPTRFTQLALFQKYPTNYATDHAYSAAVLAMAIGAHLKWHKPDVRRIGLAAFVYDLGMSLVAERIRTGACGLTAIDRKRVQKHPVFSIAMLQQIQSLEPIIQLAALQHHERENGTGYPYGYRKDRICDFARVLAIADSYAAIITPRSYCQSKSPYVAMDETLRAAQALIFWQPAVKALLKASGIFPVGSYVALSNNKNAIVTSANPLELERPTIRIVNMKFIAISPELDLARVDKKQLSIIRSIQGPSL